MKDAIMRMTADELAAHHKKYRPRAYDMDDPAERARLLRETEAYARVSICHGTDTEGRCFAYDALRRALADGYVLVKP